MARRDEIQIAPMPGQVRPGTKPGFQRPAGAPNFGSMGGRPAGSGGAGTGGGVVSRSPMERLSEDIPVAEMPPGVGGAMQAQPAAQAQARPGSPSSPASPSSSSSMDQLTPTPASAASAPAPVASSQPGPSTVPAGAGVGSVAPAPGVTPQLGPVNPPPTQFATVPTPEEMVTVPEGGEIQTPLGVGTKTGGEIGDNFRLNEAGKAQYAQSKVQRMASFGTYPLANDPRAPQPPVEPGMIAFNPFAETGKEWSS